MTRELVIAIAQTAVDPYTEFTYRERLIVEAIASALLAQTPDVRVTDFVPTHMPDWTAPPAPTVRLPMPTPDAPPSEIERLTNELHAMGDNRDYYKQQCESLSEELTANRACNLFTWKERAEKAEAALADAPPTDDYGRSRSMNKRLEILGKPLPEGKTLNEAKDLVDVPPTPAMADDTVKQARQKAIFTAHKITTDFTPKQAIDALIAAVRAEKTICSCGTTMICPDIGCDHHKVS